MLFRSFANLGNFANSDTGDTGELDRYLSRGMIDPSSETSFVSPTSQTSYTHGGSAAPTNFSESTGVGIGTHKTSGMIGFGHLPQSYGPVSAAMPVAVTIPVVLNPHSRVSILFRPLLQVTINCNREILRETFILLYSRFFEEQCKRFERRADRHASSAEA